MKVIDSSFGGLSSDEEERLDRALLGFSDIKSEKKVCYFI